MHHSAYVAKQASPHTTELPPPETSRRHTHTQETLHKQTNMLLTALDLLEMRGLPRDANLLPPSEADMTSAGSASGPGAAVRADTAAGSAQVLGSNARTEDEAISDEPCQETSAENAGAGAAPESQSLLGPDFCANGPALSTLRHTRSMYNIGSVRRNSRLVNAKLANHSASFTFKPRCASPEARQRRYSSARRHSASFPGADVRRAKSLLSITRAL